MANAKNLICSIAALCGIIGITACVRVDPEEAEAGSEPAADGGPGGSGGSDGGTTAGKDEDHDGSKTPEDCDDKNAAIHPGADPAATCAALLADCDGNQACKDKVKGKDVNCDGTPDCPSGDGGTGGTAGCTSADACQDGLFCNGQEKCTGGKCVAGTSVSCDDANPKTIDACSEVSKACSYVSVQCTADGECADGLYCNGVEKCLNNACVAGSAVDCNDGNASTIDACSEVSKACSHVPVGCVTDGQCSDGLYCNGVEKCASGTCVAGTSVSCDDGKASTQDSCNEVTDTCDHVQTGACQSDGQCADQLYCNGVEKCTGGQCVAGTSVSCDDGNPSTIDSCNEVTDVCDHVQTGACQSDGQCADQLYCNGAEKCVGGNCVAGTPVSCDDGNPSTIDSCSEVQDTCLHVPTQVCTPNVSTQSCSYYCSASNQNIPGSQTCNPQGTGYGTCGPATTFEATKCANGLDDDCDGKIDLADSECYSCTPNAVQPCSYWCAASNQNIPGSQTCNPQGTGYGTCGPAVTTEVGKCSDGVDNDCDGKTDSVDTDCGGVCVPNTTKVSCSYQCSASNQQIPGTQTCNSQGTGFNACLPEVTTEVGRCSNGLDDDCDGLKDAADTADCFNPSCGNLVSLTGNYTAPSGTTQIELELYFQVCNPPNPLYVQSGSTISGLVRDAAATPGVPRKYNGQVKPTPNQTVNGVPVSQWLCQEPSPGAAPVVPFGTVAWTDAGGSYAYVGTKNPGDTLLEGQQAAAHDKSISGGWGCNIFICIRGSGTCTIPTQ